MIKQLSRSEYLTLSKEEKRSYCLDLREYFAEAMGNMHFCFTLNKEDKFAHSLGTLFGSGECAIAGEILDYPAIELCFLIIEVMKSIDMKRFIEFSIDEEQYNQINS